MTRRLDTTAHRAARDVASVLVREGVRDEPVLVAVSGGSDSVALLFLASRTATRLGLSLHVACIDHGVREHSSRDVDFVRELAARFGAGFHTEAIEAGGDDEDSLRRARHAALLRIADAAGARFVLLGHTADDQIETIVFRFFRGAGLGGLAGMRERRDRFLRPLLSLRREALRDLLRREGLAWVEDPTNDSDRYARGRLRRGVLPALEAAFGAGALDHLLDVAPRWRADEELLEREARRLLSYACRRGSDGPDLDVEALRSGEPALQSRALRRWVRDATGMTLGSRQLSLVERWLGAIDASDRAPQGHVELPGFRIEHDGGRLRLRPVRLVGADAAARHVDIAAANDDPTVATSRRTEDASHPPEEAVLPPSGGRVRVRRK